MIILINKYKIKLIKGYAIFQIELIVHRCSTTVHYNHIEHIILKKYLTNRKFLKNICKKLVK